VAGLEAVKVEQVRVVPSLLEEAPKAWRPANEEVGWQAPCSLKHQLATMVAAAVAAAVERKTSVAGIPQVSDGHWT